MRSIYVCFVYKRACVLRTPTVFMLRLEKIRAAYCAALHTVSSTYIHIWCARCSGLMCRKQQKKKEIYIIKPMKRKRKIRKTKTEKSKGTTVEAMCTALSDDVFELLLSFSKHFVSYVCPQIFLSYAHFYFYFPCLSSSSASLFSTTTTMSPLLHHVHWFVQDNNNQKKKKKAEAEQENGKKSQAILNEIYVLRHAVNCLKYAFNPCSVLSYEHLCASNGLLKWFAK